MEKVTRAHLAGYMPIPTAEQLAEALENVGCFHDMSAELIAPELLDSLLASTAKGCLVAGEIMKGQDYGTLHIFGQQIWHDDAHIIGDRRGLELLRDLIDQALRDGVARNEGCDFFQDDGEGFALSIAICDKEELRKLSSAYHDSELFSNFDGKSPHEVVAEKLKFLNKNE